VGGRTRRMVGKRDEAFELEHAMSLPKGENGYRNRFGVLILAISLADMRQAFKCIFMWTGSGSRN